MYHQRLYFFTVCVLAALMAIVPAPSSLGEAQAWNLATYSSVSSALYKFGRNERSISADFLARPGHRLNESWRIGSSLAISKGLSGTRETVMNDGAVSVAYNGGLINDFTTWEASSSLTLPLSKQSRKADNLYTALTISPSLSFDLKNWGLEKLTPSYTLALTRAFHQYYTSVSGSAKKQYNVKNRFDLSYKAASKIAVSAYYSHSMSWTYKKARSTSFGLGQDITYTTGEQTAFSIGHENGGDMLKSNGQDSNISFVNPDSSSIYSSFMYKF